MLATDATDLVLVAASLGAGLYVGVGAGVSVSPSSRRTPRPTSAAATSSSRSRQGGLLARHRQRHLDPRRHLRHQGGVPRSRRTGLVVRGAFGLTAGIAGGFVGLAGGIGVNIFTVVVKAFIARQHDGQPGRVAASSPEPPSSQGVAVSATDRDAHPDLRRRSRRGRGRHRRRRRRRHRQRHRPGLPRRRQRHLGQRHGRAQRACHQAHPDVCVERRRRRCGVAGAVSVWTVGTAPTKTYQQNDQGPQRGAWSRRDALPRPATSSPSAARPTAPQDDKHRRQQHRSRADRQRVVGAQRPGPDHRELDGFGRHARPDTIAAAAPAAPRRLGSVLAARRPSPLDVRDRRTTRATSSSSGATTTSPSPTSPLERRPRRRPASPPCALDDDNYFSGRLAADRQRADLRHRRQARPPGRLDPVHPAGPADGHLRHRLRQRPRGRHVQMRAADRWASSHRRRRRGRSRRPRSRRRGRHARPAPPTRGSPHRHGSAPAARWASTRPSTRTSTASPRPEPSAGWPSAGQVVVITDTSSQNAHIDDGAAVTEAGSGLDRRRHRDPAPSRPRPSASASPSARSVPRSPSRRSAATPSPRIGDVAIGAEGAIGGLDRDGGRHPRADRPGLLDPGRRRPGALSGAVAAVSYSGTTRAESGAHGTVFIGGSGVSVTATGHHANLVADTST